MPSNFSAHPKAQNNNSKILMGVAIMLAVICVGITFFIETHKGVVSLAALAFITTAVLMYVKYVSADFYYDVFIDGEDTPLFVVRQRVGKRDDTLCRIELADIVDVKRESAKERRAHKREKTTALYVYTPTLAPAVSYRITVAARGNRAELVLEGSDEFFEKIKEYADSARKKRHEDDEY